MCRNITSFDMKKRIFLMLCIISTVDAGYCTQEYNCQCYEQQRYYISCGLFGWGRCTKYRLGTKLCTCNRDVCCPGYNGSTCNTPLCFGSTGCLNGGTCLSPNNCKCVPGYTIPQCSDIDECARNTSDCDQICSNTPGSYECSCKKGFSLDIDGSSCNDVDECATDNGGCEHNCDNEIGSFKCNCNEGHVLHNDSASCVDENECETGSHECHHICVNAEPFYNCSCVNGYVLLNDSQSCEDVNECDVDNGGCDQHCINNNGTFSCECMAGFVLHNDSFSCVDVDECETNRNICDHACTNTVGSFYCSCLENFSLLDDNATCDCSEGYSLSSDNVTCNDINECENENGHCEQHCKNKDGSFTCMCARGYLLQTDGRSCSDIDECSVNNGRCQHQCLNKKGSFSCNCGIGYTLGDDGLSCENITGRSFSVSLIILIDSESIGHLPFLAINKTFVTEDPKIFKTTRNLIRTHFENYTSSSFKVFIQDIKILPDVYPNKQNSILRIEVSFTVIYEEKDKQYIEVRDRLIRGTSDLSDWTVVSFNGTTAQAKLAVAENISSVCELYKKLVGDCDRGFQCTEIKNGPICRKVELPGGKTITVNSVVYTLPVLAVVVLIVVIAIAFKFYRNRLFKSLTNMSVKYRPRGVLAREEVVENMYENPLAEAAESNIKATGATAEGKGSKKEESRSKSEETESKKGETGATHEATESNNEGYYEIPANLIHLENDPNLVYSVIREKVEE